MTSESPRSADTAVAPPHFATLVEVLRGWTAEDPAPLAYRFLADGEADEQSWSRGELDRRVRVIAAHLLALGAEGKRAVLLYAPGLDYVAGFFACLYAGVIAVPAYPPDPSRLNRTLPRLQAIVADSQAEIVLTTANIAAMAQFLFAQAPDLREKSWIATDALPPGNEGQWRDPGVTADTIAFLQYTSGSTGTPKGVILTHRNLIHNLGIISSCMKFSRETVMVSWLPPYHDMGLIGGILAPIYNGGSATLMAPVAFLQRPYRWLQAVSRYRATISGGPNFAFDLCAAKISPAEREALDLSSWRVAFSGAEAVRAGTVERFIEAFTPVGLRPEAIFPCYGLAEATLIVSGGDVEQRPAVQVVDPIALDLGRVELVPAGGRDIIGCGKNLGDQEIAIVDPQTQQRVRPGEIGEIWVHGGSVAQGYWKRPDETEQTFAATLPDRPGRHFLRTGDLGFFIGEELFIAARIKDLIILRGRNHYPQDIERTAEESHPALRRGCSAAFSLDAGGEERLGFAIEIERGLTPDEATLEAIYTAIRNAVAETHDARPHTIVLLKAGSIPKTSSGKIQRRECRAGTLNHSLAELARSELREAGGPSGVYAAPRTPLEARLASIWAEVFGLPRVGIHDRFFDLGGHSLMATLVVSRIRDELKVDIGLRSLFDAPTVAALAEQVESARQAFGVAFEQRIPPVPRAAAMPASFAQERMCFLDELEGDSPAYHIPVAIGLQGPLDLPALESSLQSIVARHEILRTTFASADERPAQIIHPESALVLTVVELGELPVAERAAAAAEEARIEARRPFDLARGPLLRARLLRVDDRSSTLLLTLHHIVTDGWSMAVLVRELGALYAATLRGEPPALPPLPIQYADHAVWQRHWLQGEVLDRQLAYWKRTLEGAPEALDLPTDRPRPPVMRHRGARVDFPVPAALHAAVKELCRRDDLTPYMVLLAGFAALLHRYTGQDDLVIGSPIAGRTRPETEGLIGLFVNTLALRARVGAESTFRELLLRVKEASLFAYAHQDVPFERLVEELRPKRDLSRAPIFQVMFILQNTPLPPLDLGTLHLSPAQTDAGAAKFDLTLELTEGRDALSGALTYDSDLFDAATIERLASHYLTLLEAAIQAPKARVGELPLLPEAERQTLLHTWNETSFAVAHESTIARAFEATADRRPDFLALVAGGERLGYRELDQRANRLAHHLRALGVVPDQPVGLCLERHAGLVVGMLAILKAGGAYLPLDPSHPTARLAQLLDDAGAKVVITEASLLQGLSALQRVVLDDPAIANQPTSRLEGGAGPEHLCYVLYTSGSTGKPKGVAVEHRQVLNYLQGITAARRGLALPEGSSYAHVSTFAADLGNTVLFPPLCTGGTLHLIPAEAVADPEAISACFQAEGIDCLKIVPSHLQALLGAAHPARVLPRKLLVLGGEAASWELCEMVERLSPETRILNHYGPTETTVGVLTFPVERGLRKEGAPIVPLGRPLPNTRIYLLDARLAPVPIGVPGEVFIAGAGVARGYLHRPALTEERFLPDPFSAGGGRMYRTGDRARYLPDGTLVFLGRIDFQVKIRGFRVELGEVESVLAQHPAVAEQLLLAREDQPGDRRLVAYVVPARDREPPTSTDLRAFLKERLPEYMVPSAFVLLERLPLTPNGKIDRAALPPPEASPGAAALRAELRGPVEEALAGIFAEVLKATGIGAHDDFFERGGHSLLATQVISRIRTSFGVELPLRTVFEAPTVAALAERVDNALRGGRGLIAPPLVKVPRIGPIELSFAQERLWFLSQLDPDSASYVVPGAVRLEGQLDVSALESALREIVRRHEVLRTTYATVEGRPVAVVHADADLTLPLTKWTSVPLDERDQAIRALVAAEARRPFELSSGPMIRARLIQLDDTTHVLVLMMHHIVSDGWTRGVLNHELALLYQAFSSHTPSPLPELCIQYPDYAAWQRRWLVGDVLEKQLAHWRNELDGAPRTLALPTDRPRPPVASHRGTRCFFSFPIELSRALHELCRREGVTLFMALLSAFDVLLHRYTGQGDLLVGSPIAGRTHAETEGLIGFFVNTLVFRAQIDGARPFRDLLRQMKERAIEAYAHQDMPFERLVQELSPERDLARAPLFQVLFTLQNAPREAMTLPGLTLRQLGAESGSAKFDLSLGLAESPDGLQGSIEYATDLFDPATIARMIGHLEVLLQAITRDAGTAIRHLPLLPDDERQTLLRTWNDTDLPLPEGERIHALFEAQARKTPEQKALVAPDGELRYRELDERSNQLAHRLKALGVGPDSLVGLCLPRSTGLIVALLAVLKAGGAYVPLDPAYPPARLAQILEEAGAQVVISDSSLTASLPSSGLTVVALDGESASLAGESRAPLEGGAAPHHLCYVLFTSGSTGKPKGVAIEHRQLVSYLRGVTQCMALPAGASYAHVSTFSADLGNTVLFPPLCFGGTLHLIAQETSTNPDALAAYFHEQGIDCLKIVPSHLAALLSASHPERVIPRRLLVLGGEASSWELIERIEALSPSTQIMNHYGPTETTVGVLTYPVVPGEREPGTLIVPLGRPLPNARAYVLDEALSPAPIGIPGEVYLGGAGVARGYLGRPDLSAERFLPDPFASTAGARLYRTGDRARVLSSGALLFLGRIDHQVKVRGYRIELGEIESALAQHPALRGVAVLCREDRPGEKRLVAYVAGDQASSLAPAELKTFLAARLPEYMVPAVFVTLERLPLNANGKIDRAALPAPESDAGEREATFVAPGTPAEEALATIWAALLRLDKVGIHDNFFEVGGDSILSIQIVSRARRAGLVITPRQIFQHQTIAQLASVAKTVESATIIEEGPVVGPVPLTPIQRRFLDHDFADPHHWNQSLFLEVREALDPVLLEEVLAALLLRHDTLRLRLVRGEAGLEQRFSAPSPEVSPLLWKVDLRALGEAEQRSALEETAAKAQASLDLAEGPLLRVVLFDLGDDRPGRLLVVIHHLAVDGVSWRILLGDLWSAYESRRRGEAIRLPPRQGSFKRWAEALRDRARAPAVEAEEPFWTSAPRARVKPLPVDHRKGDDSEASSRNVIAVLSEDETRTLLRDVPRAYRTQVNDVLLTALAQAISPWAKSGLTLVDLEGHGREELFPGLEIGHTVGWFTVVYPVVLELAQGMGPGDALKAIKEQLRAVPERGVGYGLLRYLREGEPIAGRLRSLPRAEIGFNYLGQLDQGLPEASPFRFAREPGGPDHSPRARRRYLLDLNASIARGQLTLKWGFSEARYRRATVEQMSQRYLGALRALIAHCTSPEAGGYTPSDFKRAALSQDVIDMLAALDSGEQSE
jgi:amino acid adenylation domain-containing protein/non-ribosomal peptide synthase protein (TIGR01720 family)